MVGAGSHLRRANASHLSLSKLQMAWWTVVVPIVMLYLDRICLEKPEPPESLVVPMGISLLTTGISYKSVGSVSAASPMGQWTDLIRSNAGAQTWSLARAQMLLWTLLFSGMFVAEGVLTSQPWAIP